MNRGYRSRRRCFDLDSSSVSPFIKKIDSSVRHPHCPKRLEWAPLLEIASGDGVQFSLPRLIGTCGKSSNNSKMYQTHGMYFGPKSFEGNGSVAAYELQNRDAKVQIASIGTHCMELRWMHTSSSTETAQYIVQAAFI